MNGSKGDDIYLIKLILEKFNYRKQKPRAIYNFLVWVYMLRTAEDYFSSKTEFFGAWTLCTPSSLEVKASVQSMNDSWLHSSLGAQIHSLSHARGRFLNILFFFRISAPRLKFTISLFLNQHTVRFRSC